MMEYGVFVGKTYFCHRKEYITQGHKIWKFLTVCMYLVLLIFYYI